MLLTVSCFPLAESLLVHSRLDSYACPLGQFPCGNLSVCLPQLLHCNGEKDCNNGADEENCVDNSGWLQILDDMQQTKGSRARKEVETPDCGESLPKQCQCRGMAVNCTDRNLRTVPWVSSNVTMLCFLQRKLVPNCTKQGEKFVPFIAMN
uniref:LRRNT domain-containing protein n=1 Tax=Pelusios castaneus TaxID=367368 RepID=A0A8C8RPU7_9SAUR